LRSVVSFGSVAIQPCSDCLPQRLCGLDRDFAIGWRSRRGDYGRETQLRALLEASLGLEFDPGNGEIRLRNPRLPAFIDDVLLRNLQLGDARVDLRVRRVKDEVALDIVRTRGKIQVSIVLSA